MLKKHKKLAVTFTIILVLILLFFLPLYIFPKPGKIMLSFDLTARDSDKQVRDVLGLLAAHDIHATFFVTGKFAENRPDLINELDETGHEIACSAYEPVNLRRLNHSEQADQIEKCMFAVDNILGELPVGFRAPQRKENTVTQAILATHAIEYDATSFENVPLYYPDARVYPAKTSSYWMFLLSDKVMLDYYHFNPETYFSLMVNKPGNIGSFAFHPHIITQHKHEFNKVLKYWSATEVEFMTHSARYQEIVAEGRSK